MTAHAKASSTDQTLAFLLLKPDAVFRRLVGDILGHLAQLGYSPVEFRCGRVSSGMFRLMHCDNFNHRLDDWRLNYGLYAFGPAVGVLLRCEVGPPGSGSALDRLGAMKGAALPEMMAPGTVRFSFRATGRTTNLLHVPDTFPAAFREARYWFGKTRFAGLLRSWQDVRSGAGPTGYTPGVIAGEVEAHGYHFDRSFDEPVVRACLRLRVLHAIRSRTTSVPRLESISELKRAVGDVRSAGLMHEEGPKAWERVWRAEEQFLVEAEGEAAAGVQSPELDTARIAISLLLDIDRGKGADIGKAVARLWPVLRHLGVFTSPLDRFILEANATYKLDR